MPLFLRQDQFTVSSKQLTVSSWQLTAGSRIWNSIIYDGIQHTTACCLLPTCLLPTDYCLLPTVYCQLLVDGLVLEIKA